MQFFKSRLSGLLTRNHALHGLAERGRQKFGRETIQMVISPHQRRGGQREGGAFPLIKSGFSPQFPAKLLPTKKNASLCVLLYLGCNEQPSFYIIFCIILNINTFLQTCQPYRDYFITDLKYFEFLLIF